MVLDTPSDKDATREAAKSLIGVLRGLCNDAELKTAKELVEMLRNQLDYELMGQLAEAVSRRDPKDAKNRRLCPVSHRHRQSYGGRRPAADIG